MTPAAAVRLPTFFLAGAPKAGTTSLYFYLAQHPQVYMSPVKEPTFFGAAEVLASPQKDLILEVSARDRAPVLVEWDDYLALFRDVRDELAIGEASVSYLWQPSAARAIQERLPGAKLIFILRDPAQRLFTHFLGSAWRNPGETFRARFLAASNGGIGRLIVGIGRYATHLQRFLDLFPRDQISIHLYEDYQADASAVVRQVYGFLGVDADYPVDVSRRYGETMIPRFRRLHAARIRLLGAAPLARWFPESARRVLKRVYRRASDAVMDPGDRRIVIDYYRDEILRTADLIGRDLSAWLR